MKAKISAGTEISVTQDKGNFGEQTVNKLIEIVLSRLLDAESIQVRIKAKLKQLARGEKEAIAIEMSGFLVRRHLRVAQFELNIGSVAVNIQNAIRRKIEMLHPSEGWLRMVVTQEQLTSSLLAELSPSQEQIECQLRADGAIAFYFIAGENQVATYTKPRIEPDGNGVVLERCRFEGKEAPEELAPAAIAQVAHILSLGDLTNRGTRFHIQQIDIEAGKATVQANARIEQFPSA
ncbi:LmeA family phospholipid-binding protein [Microseira wollei]|uniref:DUF2993 domain-containing protein n=1 Tax=Microseira wollei NIES-4236 TaxID=2530354 RepID=A0AAV3XQB0_9CYAN|nr:DUF2993 domain-containing protein [Microseira wollei]GET43335.1 hypothetical protein MiSe_81570 [Microseira wollei NIES-4236]